ncbi:E3 ubiquitin-protein ligase RGLG3 (RING domain ligase 3) [Durusdinium trenchii]|uniref:E3 ubiquitin-protein ligase RGLG3 (RING domain ligase 3) n=1 Tax=Durusdinium trenchii TaxID=1381693 RepID=A0ABP0RWT5_9DINO
MSRRRDKERKSGGSALPVVAGVLAGVAVAAASFLASDMVAKDLSGDGKKKEKTSAKKTVKKLEEEEEEEELMDTVCPICFEHYDDKKRTCMAFNCGHTACRACSTELDECYACRKPITERLRIFLR